MDLSEIEAATKIRIRYLRAMENEEWDILPGGAYTRGFIRTYASHLGLDGERLADEYRRSTAPPGGERAPKRVEPVAMGGSGRAAPRISGRVWVAIVSLGLAGLLIGIGLAGGGGDGSSTLGPSAKRAGKNREGKSGSSTVAAQPGVAVRLAATAEVWVCLLDARGEPLIDGQILEAGREEGPFRSDGFTIALGNGGVKLLVDGREANTPASSSPVGYEIDSHGKLSPLAEGERPECV